MKKIILTSAFIILTIALSGLSHAKVTGACYNCHTMHNSQGGAEMAYQLKATLGGFEPDQTPNPSLLITNCIGCHSATDSAIWKDPTTGAPIVFNTGGPNFNTPKGLAGGNFYYVSGTVDNTGHNIFSTNPDGTLFNTPPGGTALTAQLRCAGTWGCHGHNGRQSGDTAITDETRAIKGGHHGDDTPPLARSLTDVAKNYRFLLGIKGKEDTDWEKDYVKTSHNEYQGATNFTTNTTISFLCGECHGNSGVGGFHNSTGVGTASPWLRHPTDAVLKNSGEYAGYTIYDMIAPVARPDPDNVTDTTKVTPGTDIVMCLSCHRAHASPNYKMMRWRYKEGDTLSECLSGCNVCHRSKN
ncbi:MAG: hypothetical protein Q8N82_06550 [Deltaproteobacteria bacterium]|nr:hypothetical protein [Deltaproteobacteria bacterium]